MDRKVYIYSLEYPEGNIRYVGKTIDLKQRYRRHIYDSEYRTSSRKLAWIRSLLNQGLKPIMNVIDETTESQSNFWEIHYISLFKYFGFDLTNNTFGGDGQSNPTKEVRESISKKIKQRAKDKGVWNKGVKMSEERRRRQYFLHPKRRSILQFNLNGILIREWSSSGRIKEELGYDRASILNCCRGEFKQMKGFVWIFKDEFEKDNSLLQNRLLKAIDSPKIQKYLM